MAKFQAPEGTTSISVGGAQYNTDADGRIEAPDNLAPLLLPYGFSRVPSPPPERPARGKAPAAAPATAADAPAPESEPPATPAAGKGSRKAEGSTGAG